MLLHYPDEVTGFLGLSHSIPIVLHVDSKYTLDVMQGLSHPIKHSFLLQRLLRYWEAVKLTHNISAQMVKAHTVITSNEQADDNAAIPFMIHTGALTGPLFSSLNRFKSYPPLPLKTPPQVFDPSWLSTLPLQSQSQLLADSLRTSA